MFVLSFLGLLTFAAPKQAKAEQPTYPRTVLICCPDGHCQYVFCQDEQTYKDAYAFNCEGHMVILD